MISLERRLGLGLLLALLAVFVLLFWAAVGTVGSLRDAYLLTRLEHDAQALLAAVRTESNRGKRLREGRITPIYQQPMSGHYFVVVFDDGVRIRSRSLWDADLTVQDAAPGDVTVYQDQGPADQSLFIRTAGFEKYGQRLTITVAEDVTPMAEALKRFEVIVALGLLGALVVILASQRYVLRRSFRSLDLIRDEMREIAAGEREQLQALGPSEVMPLTLEVNRLLVQLQQRLQRSRRALGNLAHALKGPLTLVTHDLDALPASQSDKQRVTDRLQRVTALVERELKRAQFAGEGSGQRFLPSRDVPELIEALERLYQQRNLVIKHSALPDQALPLDYEDMLELLGNLLDNACKWAKHRVLVRVEVGKSITFCVEDDGPGISASERASLMRRGSRLDEQEAGSGLGLAIVQDLVSHYRGEMTLGKAPELGGLSVEVLVPLPKAINE